MTALPPSPLARAAAAGQIVAWAGTTTAAAIVLASTWPAPPVGWAAGTPALEDLLASAACAALLLVLVAAAASAWASLLLAGARRTGSQRLVRLERVVVPGLVRRLAATAVGVGVLAGAGAGAASASPAPLTAVVQPLVPSWPAETVSPSLAPPSAAQPPAAVPPAGSAPLPRDARASGQPVRDVVVERGDSLWEIAERHLPPGAGIEQVAAEWPRWWSANRAVVGDDPDLIRPGQHLSAPVAGSRS